MQFSRVRQLCRNPAKDVQYPEILPLFQQHPRQMSASAGMLRFESTDSHEIFFGIPAQADLLMQTTPSKHDLHIRGIDFQSH